MVHKGARVREVGTEETIDALEVKAVLEALGARLAGEKITRAATVLRACLLPLGTSLRARDYVKFQILNQSFHRTIVEASGNPILLSLWDTLAFEVRTRFIMDCLKTVDPDEIFKEHADICVAVDSGDAESVATLSMSHSRHLVDRLRSRMTGNDESTGGMDINPARRSES